MHDKQFIELAAHVAALEYVFTIFGSDFYRLLKASPADVERRHQKILAGLSAVAVPGVDPAMSDHLAAEVQTAAERILSSIEESVADAARTSRP